MFYADVLRLIVGKLYSKATTGDRREFHFKQFLLWFRECAVSPRTSLQVRAGTCAFNWMRGENWTVRKTLNHIKASGLSEIEFDGTFSAFSMWAEDRFTRRGKAGAKGRWPQKSEPSKVKSLPSISKPLPSIRKPLTKHNKKLTKHR